MDYIVLTVMFSACYFMGWFINNHEGFKAIEPYQPEPEIEPETDELTEQILEAARIKGITVDESLRPQLKEGDSAGPEDPKWFKMEAMAQYAKLQQRTRSASKEIDKLGKNLIGHASAIAYKRGFEIGYYSATGGGDTSRCEEWLADLERMDAGDMSMTELLEKWTNEP